MLLYNIIRTNVLPVAAADLLSIISAAARSLCILEIDVEGNGVTSAYTELGLYRVGTAGATGSGAIVPAPVNPAQPAFGGVVNTAWATQPVVGALVQNIPLNSNGQRYFWRAMPDLRNAIWSPGGAVAAGSLSLRPVTVNGNISLRLLVGEI